MGWSKGATPEPELVAASTIERMEKIRREYIFLYRVLRLLDPEECERRYGKGQLT